jgi:hypothetical protein
MQRTGPGGGYHVWHGEQGPGTHANRAVVYMLYLNDLDGEGGETEFLYQKMRVKPEENLMLVWPASYTHAHRGNRSWARHTSTSLRGGFTMTEFQQKGYVLVKNFIDPDSVRTISRYLEYSVKRYPENNQGGGQGDASKISYYADPLNGDGAVQLKR